MNDDHDRGETRQSFPGADFTLLPPAGIDFVHVKAAMSHAAQRRACLTQYTNKCPKVLTDAFWALTQPCTPTAPR